jgi:hypothetical protein
MPMTCGTSITLRAKDNEYRFGLCDNFFCSQFSWLRPLYDKDGHLGGHVCAGKCNDFEEENDGPV